jgi:hypothetical protein
MPRSTGDIRKSWDPLEEGRDLPDRGCHPQVKKTVVTPCYGATMPRDGATTFGDLIGRQRLIGTHGRDAKGIQTVAL